MKKTSIVISVLFLMLILYFVLYIYRSNPLDLTGYSTFKDENKIILEIENKGFFGIELIDVMVNNSTPEKVELGISKNLILGDVKEPEVKFIPFERYRIERSSSLDQNIYFGLIIYNSAQINEVTIKYSYFGFNKKVIKSITY